jgi:hypothetical protein
MHFQFSMGTLEIISRALCTSMGSLKLVMG